MKTKVYLIVSTVVFLLVCVGHLIRLTEGWTVLVGPLSVPESASILAALVSAGVAIWGFALLRKEA